ncbi:MAG: OmpA family protein [Hyphomicrobiaceae bacterium]|nr:OmpA family protein [Hyphomicrobiaceae bacterium]
MRTATLAQQNQRLTRQRNWLARQNLAQRRYTYANFAFRNNARIFGRRRDRTVFAAFAIGAAVGAAVAGSYYVYYNDDPRLDWRSRDYYVDELGNGWTRSVVDRADGTRVVTIRDANGFIVRRYRVYDGDRYTLLYDNRPRWWDDQDLYVDVAPVRYSGPPERYVVEPSRAEPDDVYRAMTADPVAEIDRTYTLNQILMNANLRNYMPRVDLDSINFASGSAEIPEGELEKLEVVGAAMEQAIKDDKDEIYLIEGHTDRVGDEVDNMALSDERAAAVAKALTEYFDIPPENLVTQGYGEEFPKVDTDAAERRNRRVALRRITPLLDRSSNDLALDENGNEIIEDEAGQ